MYIVRANQCVMNALTPRMAINTAAFKRKSFKPYKSPQLKPGIAARVHTLDGTHCQVHFRRRLVSTPARPQRTTCLDALDAMPLESLRDTAPRHSRSFPQ